MDDIHATIEISSRSVVQSPRYMGILKEPISCATIYINADAGIVVSMDTKNSLVARLLGLVHKSDSLGHNNRRIRRGLDKLKRDSVG